jgi:hypothetical protein
MSPYLVVTGDPSWAGNLTVKHCVESRTHAETLANKLCMDCPGIVVHIFSWESGFQSKPTVLVEKIWSQDLPGIFPPASEEPTKLEG